MADALGPDLTGVYLLGSAALGDYRAGRSDLDLAVVVARRLGEPEKERLAGRLDHRTLPCPARKLELVVYERDRLRREDVSFELDLNTGPGLHEWRGDPSASPRHWFVLDVAIGREHATALAGPPAREVFPEQGRGEILRALRESLDWQADLAEPGDLVLNACRTWRFVEECAWSSKSEAARWAMRRSPDPSIVRALGAREGRRPGPSRSEARPFAEEVRARVAAHEIG